jgi:prophage antirepressor-like protein
MVTTDKALRELTIKKEEWIVLRSIVSILEVSAKAYIYIYIFNNIETH